MDTKLYTEDEVKAAIDHAIKHLSADIDSGEKKAEATLKQMGISSSGISGVFIKITATSAATTVRQYTLGYLNDREHRQKEEALNKMKQTYKKEEK